VATYHTDWPRYSTHYGLGMLQRPIYSFLRWVHNGCTLTFCPSTATLDDLREHGFRRLRLWGRGVDTQRFHPDRRSDSWRTAIGARPNDTILLYVGRLAGEKRLDLLADALDGMQDVRMVFVGDGPARQHLEKRLDKRIAHFTGYLRGDELAAAYAGSDLFVFPSDTETFGQVVQEAMASGLPVAAARAGGAADLVRHGETGLLFTPGNTAELRTHIRTLTTDPQLRAVMGRNARAIAERHTWDRVLDELIGHYRHAQRHNTRLGVTFMGMARPPLRREEISS
jgi:glycosyltransferase involved in cell wall biosynthesis